MSTHKAGFERFRLPLTILVALLAVAAVTVSLIGRDRSGEKLMVTARFASASPLLPGNDVRTNGVKVGTISSIEKADGGGAVVGLELDEEALPIHEDASVKTRPVSLLGEQYIDLDPGTPGSPVMKDGGVIPESGTGASVGLDEVLNTLDEPTSASLGLLVTALGSGLDGNGENAGALVKALAPALTRTQDLTRVLEDQNDTLGRLVDSMEPVAGAMAVDEGKALNALVDSSRGLLARTAANDEALREMLRELPGTLATARTTLGKLSRTADATAPTLAALRPTTGQLDQLSVELERFAAAADPALSSSAPMLREAEKLLREARPVAAALRGTGPSLVTTARGARPLSQQVASRFTSMMEFIRGWALTTNGRDGLSHYFRGNIVLSASGATGLLPGGSSPQSTTTSGPLSGPLGGLTDGLLGGSLGGLGGLGDLTTGLTGGLLRSGTANRSTDAQGGVTGLTADQELAALGYLLGGN